MRREPPHSAEAEKGMQDETVGLPPCKGHGQAAPGKNASIAINSFSEDERHQFRLMAANLDVMEECFLKGITSRSGILRAIERRQRQQLYQQGKKRTSQKIAKSSGITEPT